MSRNRKPREKNLTGRFLSGNLEEGDLDAQQRFGSRSKDAELSKILRTALLRAEENSDADVQALPVGEVLQVYSLFSEMESGGRLWLCLVRKTLNRRSDSAVLVGDRVRFRDLGLVDDQGRPQAVIEEVLPRDTILTRSDSFKASEQHPIVANAQQMLIVTSVCDPQVKWGLVDRMIVAALSGKMKPIICLNKVDLETEEIAKKGGKDVDIDPLLALAHYESIGISTIKTSVPRSIGLETLRESLRDQTTVLAGHSGVGKSTLLNAIQPTLHLRTGAISNYTGKGRHTTTSARRYPLEFGGAVIDTPGVKMFGLWNVTRENLREYFHDVVDGTAPAWRQESFERIVASLSGSV
jgi:ribosome biogenesis GTPase